MLMEHFQIRRKTDHLTSLTKFRNTTGRKEGTTAVGNIVQIHNESLRVRLNLVLKVQLKENDGFI